MGLPWMMPGVPRGFCPVPKTYTFVDGDRRRQFDNLITVEKLAWSKDKLRLDRKLPGHHEDVHDTRRRRSARVGMQSMFVHDRWKDR